MKTAAAGFTVFSPLDNMVQGMVLQSLESFSPIATVWSPRRVVLLRVQLLKELALQVLRTEEYSLPACGHCRCVYASALPLARRVRLHRAVAVLSSGYAVILHL